MTIKYYDTQQMIRNTFVFDRQLIMITDRDKSRAIRGLGRKVARFLPERVGRIIVAYIAWLLPFEKMLHEQVRMPELSVSVESYLWKDGRKGAWETTQLNERLALITGTYLGVELAVSDYRYIAIGLGRKIKKFVIR